MFFKDKETEGYFQRLCLDAINSSFPEWGQESIVHCGDLEICGTFKNAISIYVKVETVDGKKRDDLCYVVNFFVGNIEDINCQDFENERQYPDDEDD